MVSQNCPGPSWYVIENVFLPIQKIATLKLLIICGERLSLDMNYKQFGAYFSWVF